MKVGIEEEFIVVDPETRWITPGAFRLANSFVYSDVRYIQKCSVELPLQSGSLSTILSNLSKAFCVFELKTDPYEDIDSLREEIVFHRRNLIDHCTDQHLMVLPSGLHPNHQRLDFIDNCAAFHVHVDYADELFDRLVSFVPFFIAVSSNSPFLDGTIQMMTNRMQLSPHVNLLVKNNKLKRNADVLFNPVLNTIEIKVFDSQITVDESIGLVSMVKAIAENPSVTTHFSQKEFEQKRNQAITSESVDYKDFISSDDLDLLTEYDQFSLKKISMKPGSVFQIEIFQKYGLSSVVHSLYESFIQDKRIIKKSDDKIDTQHINSRNLGYFLSYSPFFMINKYKKYVQDMKQGKTQIN